MFEFYLKDTKHHGFILVCVAMVHNLDRDETQVERIHEWNMPTPVIGNEACM